VCVCIGNCSEGKNGGINIVELFGWKSWSDKYERTS